MVLVVFMRSSRVNPTIPRRDTNDSKAGGGGWGWDGRVCQHTDGTTTFAVQYTALAASRATIRHTTLGSASSHTKRKIGLLERYGGYSLLEGNETRLFKATPSQEDGARHTHHITFSACWVLKNGYDKKVSYQRQDNKKEQNCVSIHDHQEEVERWDRAGKIEKIVRSTWNLKFLRRRFSLMVIRVPVRLATLSSCGCALALEDFSLHVMGISVRDGVLLCSHRSEYRGLLVSNTWSAD